MRIIYFNRIEYGNILAFLKTSGYTILSSFKDYNQNFGAIDINLTDKEITRHIKKDFLIELLDKGASCCSYKRAKEIILKDNKMNILYVHGLGGGVESKMGLFIKKHCPYDNVYTPEIPQDPNKAQEFILNFCNEKNINLIIGHSLGGFYAMTIGGVKKILVNPLMYASDIKSIGLGTFEYHSKRENGDTKFIIDEEFINKLKVMEDFFYSDVDQEIKVENDGVFSLQDELFSHVEDFKKVFNKEPVLFNGLHSLTEEEFINNVLPLIKDYRREYFILNYGKDIYSRSKCEPVYDTVPEALLKFKLDDNYKEYTLEGMYNVPVSHVLSIPEYHNDLPVTKIKNRAFVYCHYYNCVGIYKIIIPKTIKEIADESFYNLRCLHTIEVDKENKYFHVENDCLIRNCDNKVILKPGNDIY